MIRYACLGLILLLACAGEQEQVLNEPKFYQPQVALEELYHDVQMAHVFEDSKTFADCRPRFDPGEILSAYRLQRERADFDLKAFVDANFLLPEPVASSKYTFPAKMSDHIPAYWQYLVREPEPASEISTLIPLPYPYVVPGGRFREIYYWDSYFTMQGLAVNDRWDLIRSMIENFAFLVDTLGHIPNGNRSYFISRSQPPFFGAMVTMLMDSEGEEEGEKYLSQLHAEYRFWMNGEALLNEQNHTHRRVVRMPDGTILNRYFDDVPEPRPESYREDVLLASGLDSMASVELFRNLRAACESGWDFSSRWLADGRSLATIETTRIIPVDLNTLLLHLESVIARIHEYVGDHVEAEEYYQRAGRRATAINNYLWDAETGFYQDMYFEQKSFTGRLSLAGMYPFYFDLADKSQMDAAVSVLQQQFVVPGGLVSTTAETGQQWDAPNGWAPLQWISIVGLARYEEHELAYDLARKWIDLNAAVYSRNQKMMEKYNVTDLTLDAGGGEYPTQDGFGWTNGVVIALMESVKEPEDALGN